MKGWINNLLNYEKTGKAGECPYCNSRSVKIETHGAKRKSVTFTCLQCRKSEHFDGTVESKAV